jgi:geranylgeranyl diphosphate synthase type I
MDWLQSQYPVVRDILRKAVPGYWPELQYFVEGVAEGPLIPETILPLAACKAAGGKAQDAVHVAAALVAAAASLRILDDLEDQDRPDRLWAQVGPAQAWNYAAALQSMAFSILGQAPLTAQVSRKISRTFADGFLHVTCGQNRDLGQATTTIEGYWATVAEKIGFAYATGCATGAMIATDEAGLIEACGNFGFHLGYVIQIVNDMESIWRPDGATDLKQGKITLPLLYGLTGDHPARDELALLVNSGEMACQGDRIKEILDAVDARSFIIWAALQERDQALQAISICPDSEGRQALEAYVTGLFGDIEPLMPSENRASSDQEPVQRS